MKRLFVLLFLVAGPTGLQAQIPVDLLGTMPETVQESSGLLLLGDRFITHNDSGNSPVLYELDTTTLAITREVVIEGVENTDWEDLAQDEQYLYIADFGNNVGARTDLKILRVSKADFSASTSVSATLTSFSYEDQTDFSGVANSDWDAEALIVRGDSLIIFTKQWQSGGTAVYYLPKTPGEYTATRLTSYDAGGLITAASPDPSGDGVLLLGYSQQLQPFLITVPGIPGPGGFPEGTRKDILEIGFGQTEGITIGPGGRIYISSERFSNALVTLPPSVFVVQGVPGETPEPPDGGGPPEGGGGTPGLEEGEEDLVLFRSPGSEYLEYVLGNPNTLLARAVFDASGRRVLFENASEAEPGRIDISGLGTAVYYLTLYLRGETLSKPFLRY